MRFPFQPPWIVTPVWELQRGRRKAKAAFGRRFAAASKVSNFPRCFHPHFFPDFTSHQVLSRKPPRDWYCRQRGETHERVLRLKKKTTLTATKKRTKYLLSTLLFFFETLSKRKISKTTVEETPGTAYLLAGRGTSQLEIPGRGGPSVTPVLQLDKAKSASSNNFHGIPPPQKRNV